MRFQAMRFTRWPRHVVRSWLSVLPVGVRPMQSGRGLGQSHPRGVGATRNLADSHRTHADTLYVQANGRNGVR